MKPLIQLFFAAVLSSLTLTAAHGADQPPIRLDSLMPSVAQLGGNWTSNHVIVLLDPLSQPHEVCNEDVGWLQAANRVIGMRGISSFCVSRYSWDGPGSFLVNAWRYESEDQIGDRWGKDYDGWGNEVPSKQTLADLPEVGDEVRFYKRHGMHGNIAFRRGEFVFDVEGSGRPEYIPRLKELAEAIDKNLIKAQEARTNASSPSTSVIPSVEKQKSSKRP